ncbi:MAG: hypothetical protein V4805_10215 [Pseudomonadota bacterium]
MNSLMSAVLSYLSKACGLESISAFPSNHTFRSTHWDPAYFDIAFGTKPDAIERALCTAIDNTPLIFAHINNPTPRMQRALLGLVNQSLRRNDGKAGDYIKLLIAAYSSPATHELLPGLRAVIANAQYEEGGDSVQSVLEFLASTQAPFDVIEAAT